MRKFIIKNYKNIGVEKEVSLNLPIDGGLCASFLFGLSTYATRIADGDNFNEAFKAASIVFGVAFIFPCSFTLFILTLMKADMDKKERE